MDDFVNGLDFDTPSQAWRQAYLSLSSEARVCPVVYDTNAGGEPAILQGASCVVAAVEPSAGSVSEIFGSAASVVDQIAQASPSAKVLVLAYGSPFSLWASPIPANYLTAMGELASNMGTPEVLWH